MALSQPKCAVNMEQRLAALRRDQEIDGLRVYLIKYNLFPRNRDPENSPIRVEELKELVKHWKLHRQRGFWRDHPEKDDLVRALLQHIRSEAANKKRRQEAQEKYNRSHKGNQCGLGGDHGGGTLGFGAVGSGEMSDTAKRDFSMILSGGKDYLSAEQHGAGEGDDSVSSSFLKNRMGGDLFYQRGNYDEGMIYLSRVDKSRFSSEGHDPRNDLFMTSAASPTPLGHLVQMGAGAQTHGIPHDKTIPAVTTTLTHTPISLAGLSSGFHAMNPAALTRDMKLKSMEGLFNVSCHRGFEAQVLREGALATIAAMLKTDDAALRLLAGATLLNLTAIPPTSALSQHQYQMRLQAGLVTTPPPSAKELYGKMIDDGVLASLLDLAHTSHPLVKSFCARTLFRFTIDENHHFRMVHEGVVVSLTQLLTAIPGDDDHRQACIHALVNLAAIPRAVTCDSILNTLIAIAKNAVATLVAPPPPSSMGGLPGEEKESPVQKANAILRGCSQALLNLSILPTTRSSMIEEGAMIAMSVVVSTKQLALCETVSNVLCNCASIRTNQDPMIKTNAATLLSELLELVTASFERLHREEDEAVQAEADADARQLFSTARELLHRIRRNCANVIGHFCCNTKLQTRVMSAGFVPKLLTIARLGDLGPMDEETEKFCIIGLANLALEDRCRQSLVQDGAVPLLLRILNEKGTAAPVVSSGEDAESRATSRTLLKLDCVTALSNLMLHPKNFARMVDEGVVPALLAMVQQSDNAAIQRACVYAMLNMARDPAMKTRLAQATGAEGPDAPPGAIPTMLAYASKQLNNAELCAVCVSFFEHLSTREENYEVLYYEGVVGLLVRVLQKKSTAEPVHVIYGLWLSSMTALSNLANHPEKRATFLDDGVLEAIQHVLSAASSDTRRRDKRVETQTVRMQFAASQIVFKLQELCCGPKKADVPAFFSSLLLLSTQAAAKNSRLERRAVHYQHKTVLQCALAIARSATLSQRGMRLLATHTEFPPALNGIMRTGLHEAQVCAAIALCNLATERGKLKPRLWRDATTDDFIVVTLLRLNSDQTKEICAKALFNLLTHEDTRDQMIKDGVLYALIKLSSRLESEEIRDLALRSIYNISLFGSAQQQLLLDMEIVRVLAKMYQAEFSKEMKRLLCGILSNLSSVPGHEQQILAEGALSVIKHLAKVRDPETKVYAANILYNLSCCADVVDTLVRGSSGGGSDESGATAATASGGGVASSATNVLSLLIALLKSESRDARRYAALTVANLSANALAVQLMTEGDSVANGNGGALVGVLNDALKRTMASCLETSASCVFALRNLLTVAANLQRFIDCNGVVTLAAILACAEMESETRTLHVATDLLCGLANFEQGAPGFEERLVKDGIIRALQAIAKGSASLGASATTAASAAAAMNIITSLSNLSRNRHCHELMLRDGVLDTVALLARTNLNSAPTHGGHAEDARAAYKGLVAVKGEDFCHHCVVVLRNLAHQEDPLPGGVSGVGRGAADANANTLEVKGQRLAGQPAVVQIALAHAQSTNAETREHVVVTLHNLALHRRCRQQLLKHDGVKVILKLGTNATSAVKRHICGMALQLLSKHNDTGDDPHSANIKQEGIVAAIAALAEPHHSDLLVLATKGLHAIVEPKPNAGVNAPIKPGKRVNEAALLPAGHAPLAQKGAPPDWAKVTVPNLAPWPELEALAVAVNSGKDADYDEEYDDENGDDDSDEEAAVAAVAPTAASAPGSDKKPHAKSSTTATAASSGSAAVPSSPTNSRLRALPRADTSLVPSPSSTVTAPRVCSVDTVLGALHLLEDETLDKVRVNIEAELAALTQRRSSSAVGPSRGLNGELPALLGRPSSAPETEDANANSGATATASDTGGQATTTQRRSTSTLSLARHDAAAAASSSGRTSPHSSPLKSPSLSSMAGTPKRKSRTLEPLSSSASSPAL